MVNVGQRVLRREDGPLLTGQGQFVDDIVRPGMVHARFVRSVVAHGTIRSIDIAEAAALPGVHAVLTGADLGLPDLVPPLEAPGVQEVSRPVLAVDRIRFAGEPLAIVLADSPYVAEDASELVDVDIDPLPVVASVVAALAEGAPVLHPGLGNVLFETGLDTGPVDEHLRDAPVQVHMTLTSPRQTALPMESRAMIAEPHGDGLRIWASTQTPHILRRALADLLALPVDTIEVSVPDVGGGFGLKAHTYPEEVVVAAVARRLGRPVKWIEDRSDNLAAACHARDQQVVVRAAANEAGLLLAIEADITCDVGAYGVYAHGHLLETVGTPSMIPGPYRLPAYRYRSRAVATNKCPEGAYRGVGLPVSTLVHERVMDAIAAQTGLDPVEVRRANLIAADELPYTSLTGQTYDSGDYQRALTLAAEAIGWSGFPAEQEAARREGRLIGASVCCYVEYTAVNSRVFSGRGMRGLAGFDDAHVALRADGTAEVWTTLPSAGQGLATTFAQLAADGLGLPLEAVTVRGVDTSVGDLEGTGTFASRSAVSGGGAIDVTSTEIRRRLIEDAAAALEAAEADLELRDGVVRVVGSPGAEIGYGQLAAADPGRYRVSGRFDPPALTYPYGAHACTVEVEPDTGRVRILRYVVVEDCGRVINPLVVDGQVHGAVAQGIAGALFESIVYDEQGQLQTGSLMDYLVPTASELPSMQIEHLAVIAAGTGLGAKGVGESGTLAPGAVLAGAVESAVGAPCTVLPIHPQWVQRHAARRLTDPAGASP